MSYLVWMRTSSIWFLKASRRDWAHQVTKPSRPDLANVTVGKDPGQNGNGLMTFKALTSLIGLGNMLLNEFTERIRNNCNYFDAAVA
jgi:hypothetical protein